MLKNLLEENFKVTLFEQRASIGGVWQFVEDENQTSVLQSEHEEACSRRRMTKKNPATIGNVSKYTVGTPKNFEKDSGGSEMLETTCKSLSIMKKLKLYLYGRILFSLVSRKNPSIVSKFFHLF